jgi:CHAT domain-containing protein
MPALQGAARVLIVPDGAINLVPFAALPAPNRVRQYLLERGPMIHYLSAERDFVSYAEALPPSAGGLLALGEPSFADVSTFAALSAERPKAPAARLMAESRTLGAAGALAQRRGPSTECATFATVRFTPLPGTGREVEDVAAAWNVSGAGTPAQVLQGVRATERALKESIAGHRVLHLATHGFVLGDECEPAPPTSRAIGAVVASRPSSSAAARVDNLESPLLSSGLALAGANRRAAAGPDEDDGILTAEEVASLDLSGLEWAVLSACDTGLGVIRAGEGVLGLRRAFQIAGARTVIMSLWSVDDRATRQWMTALYRSRLVDGLDTADSVRAAALAVLKDRRARGLSGDPFFWAPFVAAGDWH